MTDRQWLLAAAAAFLAAAVLLPFAGPSSIDLRRVWQHEDPDWSIFIQLRVSRTLLGLFAGASLALGGALYQAMLRDSLATPYTLGVSSGASLGAVIAIVSGWRGPIAIPPTWIGALIGGAASLTLATGAMSRAEGLSPYRLLLAGIALNSVNSALILLVYGLSGISTSFAITRWLIGSLDAIPLVPLAAFIVLVLGLAAVIVGYGRSWTLLSVGDDWAGARGVDAQRLAWLGYITGSILAAVTVAVAGPIGFVGLIVPHLVRARISPDARLLMPCAFCFGGVLLAACDALGRTMLAPAEVPAGAITACIGGPYLVWIVRRR